MVSDLLESSYLLTMLILHSSSCLEKYLLESHY